MRQRISFALLVCGAFGAAQTVCHARPIPYWPYSSLFERASTVVIASFDSEARSTADKPPDEYYDTLLVKFSVLYVLKGKCDEKQITLLYYAGKPELRIQNMPSTVSFRKTNLRVTYGEFYRASRLMEPPEYMLFLKKRGDGRYEPVSGTIDIDLGIRQLDPPFEDISAPRFPQTDDEKRQALSKDYNEIQGRWREVAWVWCGHNLDDEKRKRMILVVSGRSWKTFYEGSEKDFVKGHGKLDPTKRPKSIDFELTEGEGKGNYFGVYELNKTYLKLCYAPADWRRPKEVVSRAGTFDFLITFERENAK